MNCIVLLGISNKEGIDRSQPFSSLGLLDSLMITEIQQLLGMEYNILITVEEVNQLTLEKLERIENP